MRVCSHKVWRHKLILLLAAILLAAPVVRAVHAHSHHPHRAALGWSAGHQDVCQACELLSEWSSATLAESSTQLAEAAVALVHPLSHGRPATALVGLAPSRGPPSIDPPSS